MRDFLLSNIYTLKSVKRNMFWRYDTSDKDFEWLKEFTDL